MNVQHALNPEILVLAGGMSKAGDFLLGRASAFHFADVEDFRRQTKDRAVQPWQQCGRGRGGRRGVESTPMTVHGMSLINNAATAE
ncbi:MAG: hypothetical protein R3E58_01510 [Phycisphaerae bacterium]